MKEILRDILLAFIPIFVAVDAIGILPFFISLTADLTKKQKTSIIIQSMFTASGLALGFILIGKIVFNLLGITIGDFMIAGGAILFCIAITDILNSSEKRRGGAISELGAVPLGTPLIVGPAVLTTSLVIIDQYGIIATIVSVIVNILLAGFIFLLSSSIMKFLGDPGSKALSKIMSLLLAAIAVMLIRKGILPQ